MASATEGSIASVPLTTLDHFQQEILQKQRALQPEANHHDAPADQHARDHEDDDLNEDVVIEESANAYRTPPVSSPKTAALKIPRLESSKSAPPGKMEAMMDASPSQDMFHATARANSFHAFEWDDTQPMESQVYRDFSESVRMSKTTDTTTPKKDKMLLQISPDGRVEMYTDTTAKTPRTCEEGDTGYVDLAKAWSGGSPGSPEEETTSQMEELLLEPSPSTQLPAPDVFRKPAMPETPSLAGHKRRRSGEMLTSQTTAKKTPGFSQLFGVGANRGGLLSEGQLFEQTQEASSPMPGAPRSDPVLTRPSPNMNHITHSSPALMMSSPMLPSNNKFAATNGEPRDKYTSCLESQERRKAARLKQEAEWRRFSDGTIDDFEDSDDDPALRQIRAKRLERARSAQTLPELRKMRVASANSARPATSSSPRKAAIIDLRTPATTRKPDTVDFEVSDDEESDQEQILKVDDPDDGEQSENDVYDELAQTVLRSQGQADGDEDEEEEGDESTREDEGEAHVHQAEHHRTAEVTTAEEEAPRRTLVQGSSQPDRHLPRRSQNMTQHSAIADSQPLRLEAERHIASQNGAEKSPNCSYVPGSQYEGRTSQDQARLSQRPASGLMGPPNLSTSKSEETAQVIPSSPPLAAASTSNDQQTLETPHESESAHQQPQPEKASEELVAEQVIPESDLAGPPSGAHGSSRPATAEDHSHTAGNTAPFSTARSHLSTNGPSPQKIAPPTPLKSFASQQSKVSSQSPRTRAGVRRFADIAGVESPKPSNETQLDLDAIMSDIITAEDQQVLAAISSPVKERPTRVRKTAVKNSDRSKAARAPSPARESDAAQPPPMKKVRMDKTEPAAVMADPSIEPVAITGVQALRESPSKANEQRSTTPPVEQDPDSTPDSVKLREEAGAKAASQLLFNRNKHAKKPAKLYGTGPEARLQSTEKKLAPKRDDASKKGPQLPAPETNTTVDSNVAMRPTDEVTKAPEIEETVLELTDVNGVSEENDQANDIAQIVAPHRVFALFKGTFNMFYPATWLGTAPNTGGHRVRFDDGTITSVESHLACRLELCIDDQIKVDYQGMRNKMWVVKGFGEKLQPARASKALTDTLGHEIVQVQGRSSRNSVSGRKAVPQGEGTVVNVAIAAVYLTQSMWSHFASRDIQPEIGRGISHRVATPSTGVQTPVDSETPTSRSRRTGGSTMKALEKRASSLREDFAVPARSFLGSGLFAGMAFAISFGQNEADKLNVTRLIQQNGGIILEDGFENLFDAPKLGEADVTTPARTPDDSASLELKPEYQCLGFVALIADKHSRRAKYIQALALGIPTLSGRWITDSLDTAKNNSLAGTEAAPLAWVKYLLAAGESSYLSGAIRSRNLTPYGAVDARLGETIQNRELLLQGDGVLIVASKKSKAVWERRKAFAFLTLALGAGHVKRVSDLSEAKDCAHDQPQKWKFIYVDGSVADASTAVFGKGRAGGKKRKREDAVVAKVDAKAMCASDGRIRVVNDEFVVQSLILGALVD